MADLPYPDQPILIVETTGQVFPLSQEIVTIGRKSGNTIVLGDDLKASRHHATIQWEADHFLIRDAGSSNGTFVNEYRLSQPYTLRNGDRIRVGDTQFRVKLPLAETEPSLTKAETPPPPAAPPAAAPAAPQKTDLMVMKAPTPLPLDNPYVGPRTFTQQESDRYFGREVEARELLSLVISERLVLFYAQSGAGKSSLINTRLVSQLRAQNNAVLPIGRVSGVIPEGITNVSNIYAFNLMLSLDESDGDPRRYTQMRLTDFLANLASPDGILYYYDDALETNEFDFNLASEAGEEVYEEAPYVLIIDQFEEIITTHPERWPEREGFFQQLAEAMNDDPLLWVVLSLREDYVAPLDPYKHLLPNHLRAHFYMQRMSYEAALEAVKKPAEHYGRPFAPGVAESMVDNLRQIRVQGARSLENVETKPGQFIEPVQLQVVCFQLWERLKQRPVKAISQQDLAELGNIDEALALFYEQVIEKVIREANVAEIDLRSWFEKELITETGTRGAVYRGITYTGGIPNQAVDLLNARFLLRSEVKAGGTWYELVHDRFVQPILQANQAWRLQQPLLQMARTWVEADRNPSKLLAGQQLTDALETKWQGLGEEVEEFLTVSQTAEAEMKEAARREREHLRQLELDQARQLAEEQQKRAELEAQSAAKLRRRAWWLAIIFSIALLMTSAAAWFGFVASSQQSLLVVAAERADAARQTAESRLWAAATAQQEKVYADQTAEAGAAALMMSQEVVEQATAEIQKVQRELYDTLTQVEATLLAEATGLAAEATEGATAEAGTPPAPVSPTRTPTGVYTLPTPTPRPSPTATATPNLAATATVLALDAALAEVRAKLEAINIGAIQTNPPTFTPAPTSSPTPTSTPCPESVRGELRPAWEIHRIRLGCSRAQEPLAGLFAEQAFENGFMIWSEALDLFFVAIGDENGGVWQLFAKTDFNPDGAGCEPAFPKSSPELVQPVRGFGGVWCSSPELQRAIGYGTQEEYGVREPNLVQPYERGFIVRNSKNQVYIFFSDNETYLRQP